MSFVVAILLYLVAFLLSLAVVAIVGLIIYARWNYGVLEELGIPVVKPNFFLGSNPDGHNLVTHLVDYERSKAYGPVYGVYDGRQPTIFVTDPEMIRLILVRDFEHFRNHRKFPTGHHVVEEVLDFIEDEKWKTVRSALTPSFTTGKIKVMCETVCGLSEEYVAALLKDMNGEKRIKMDFRKYCPPLILEIIGKCFCGINIENARDPNNKFIEALKTAMGGDFFEFDWTYTFANTFPFIHKLVPVFPNDGLDMFEKTMKNIIKEREESQIVKQDQVNTLMTICKKSRTDQDYKKLGITETTGIAQAYEFYIASYAAMRTTLSLLTFHLATHPAVLQKMLDEIDSSLKKNSGVINYDTVADLPYVTACISESIRLTPAFLRPDRACNKDWEHNRIKIKKGMNVIIPIWALHRNPVIYPDPENFIPERFLSGNKERLDPYALVSFGHGPRACIGNRFAFEALKILICNYFKEFTVEKRSDTVFEACKGNPFLLEYKPLFVDFVRRN